MRTETGRKKKGERDVVEEGEAIKKKKGRAFFVLLFFPPPPPPSVHPCLLCAPGPSGYGFDREEVASPGGCCLCWRVSPPAGWEDHATLQGFHSSEVQHCGDELDINFYSFPPPGNSSLPCSPEDSAKDLGGQR